MNDVVNKNINKKSRNKFSIEKKKIIKICIAIIGCLCLFFVFYNIALSSKDEFEYDTNCTLNEDLYRGIVYYDGVYEYHYMQEWQGDDWSDIDSEDASEEGWGVIYVGDNKEQLSKTKICSFINSKPIISTANMFNGVNASYINFKDFSTSEVINMDSMFNNATLQYLNLSSLNTDKVINMQNLFANAKIGSLIILNFNIDKVENMSSMFENLSTDVLDLSSFDFNSVDFNEVDVTDMLDNANIRKGYVKTIADANILNNQESVNMNKPDTLIFDLKSRTNDNYITSDDDLMDDDTMDDYLIEGYDSYYIEERDEEYYLMRKNNEVAKLKKDNSLRLYKDESDKNSKYIAVSTYNDEFKLGMDYGKYAIGSYYLNIKDYDGRYISIIYNIDTGKYRLFNGYIDVIYNGKFNQEYFALESNINDERHGNDGIIGKDLIRASDLTVVNKDYWVVGNSIQTGVGEPLTTGNDKYLVSINKYGKDIKYGLTDYDGKVVIDFLYDDLISGINEKILLAKKGKKFGAIDINGKTIVDFEYDGIDYGNGYYVVLKDNKLGVLDENGKVIVPINIEIAHYGEYKLKLCCADFNSYGISESNDKETIIYYFDKNSEGKNKDYPGYQYSYLVIQKNGKYKIYDTYTSNEYIYNKDGIIRK